LGGFLSISLDVKKYISYNVIEETKITPDKVAISNLLGKGLLLMKAIIM